MANNYIDQKVTIWRRYHFSENANMQEIANRIKEEGTLDYAIDPERGFLEAEELYETEYEMLPKDNEGDSTIEVYNNKMEIYNNSNLKK